MLGCNACVYSFILFVRKFLNLFKLNSHICSKRNIKTIFLSNRYKITESYMSDIRFSMKCQGIIHLTCSVILLSCRTWISNICRICTEGKISILASQSIKDAAVKLFSMKQGCLLLSGYYANCDDGRCSSRLLSNLLCYYSYIIFIWSEVVDKLMEYSVCKIL